jgi:peptide subunit release factor 1 (eRF1)
LSISRQFSAFANVSGSAPREPSPFGAAVPKKKKKKGRSNTQLHRIREASVEELHSEIGASSRENGENIV